MAHEFIAEMKKAEETQNWQTAHRLVRKLMALADIAEVTSEQDMADIADIAARRNGYNPMGKKIV